MPISFIHLSDIHFGQEKGGVIVVHDDVKERLIEDVQQQVAAFPEARASGVIVCGDIAYAGKREQYAEAAKWLDRIAAAAGCANTDVQVVPGNHDVDRAKISEALTWMLGEIKDKGEPRLDKFLESDNDRALLYSRFHAYEPFAMGYASPLDKNGGNAGSRIVKLAPGRHLQFIGLNTALICAKADDKASLLLGARQRVLPRQPGYELVVITHHPLDWLQDSVDARDYLRARARVFISGHEHKPCAEVDPVSEGCDLLMLASGAAVPPTNETEYGYTYNLLQFEWEAETDSLAVTVIPRVWNNTTKLFDANPGGLGKGGLRYSLGCPQFRAAAKSAAHPAPASQQGETDVDVPMVQEEGVIEERTSPSEPLKYSQLRLTFFRDLTATQRVSVLVKLNALPPQWQDALMHSAEQKILESLQLTNRLDELDAAIQDVLSLAAPIHHSQR